MNLLDSDYIGAAQRQFFLDGAEDVREYEVDHKVYGAWVITRVFVPVSAAHEVALERVVEERYQSYLKQEMKP